jgi:hypothetical protein
VESLGIGIPKWCPLSELEAAAVRERTPPRTLQLRAFLRQMQQGHSFEHLLDEQSYALDRGWVAWGPKPHWGLGLTDAGRKKLEDLEARRRQQDADARFEASRAARESFAEADRETEDDC